MRLRLAIVAALALGVGWAAPRPAGAQGDVTVQEAILRAKPAVVLVIAEVTSEVILDCGSGPTKTTPPVFRETGTGWFIDGNGWVITNGHVVQPAHETPRWLVNQQAQRAVSTACLPKALERAGITPGDRPDAEDAIKRRLLDRVLPTVKVMFHPQVSVLTSNGARLKAEVKKYSPPVSAEPGAISGRDLALLKVSGENFPVLPLADAKVVQLGDPIHILGFPGVVLSHELLNQSASVEASVTNGAVSGFKQDKSSNPVIQTDAPAAWGNSGGPAVNQKGAVVGVLTFVSLAPGPEGAIVQGFNFIIPSQAVKGFVTGTPVNLAATSKFNEMWFAGLQAFFTEDWKGAARLFEGADKLLPGLPDVKRMLAEAQDKVKHPPPRPFPWAWATLGVTLVSAGGYGGLVARRWWRNRFRVTPSQVIRLMEKGVAPVFVDVRTKPEYETSPLRLPGAIRLEPEEVEAGRINLEPGTAQLIVAYCATPEEATSARVTQHLRRRGYRNVKILKGGLGGWTNGSLPVESKSHLPAIGLEIYKNLALGDVERRRVKAGEVIFKQDDDPHGEAFVVHGGQVDIRKRVGDSEHVVAQLGEGQLFGEMALFRHAQRAASAVAATDVELLVIKAERLEWLIRNRPQLTIEILKRLSDLLAAAP